MLGRPFGAPGLPGFQRRVVLEALGLLEAQSGPVLRDFPEDAPATGNAGSAGNFACPVNFPRRSHDSGDGAASLGKAVLAEVSQLAPWHDIAVKRLGRTTVGISGLSIEDAARHAASYLSPAAERPREPAARAAEMLKRACDDLKSFYTEAAQAQPGATSDAELERWFWNETAAGEMLVTLRDRFRGHADPAMQTLARMLVPRGVATRT